jgi:hypothetical protein
MCGLKEDIVLSASKPTLCYACEATIRRKPLNENFIAQLRKELKFIKKPLYYRIFDWVKKHPILSLVITLLTTIIVDFISTTLYNLIFGGLAQ